MGNLIYFNNNKVAIIDDEVDEYIDKIILKMNPTLDDAEAEAICEEAVYQACSLIHCSQKQLTFNSDYERTLRSVIHISYETLKSQGNHIISCKTESEEVLDYLKELQKKGAEVTYLNVDKEGLLDLEELRKNYKPSTIMVCITAVNSETGVFQPIEAIGKLCKEAEYGPIFFLCDGLQIVGKTRCDVEELGVDCLIFSSHTIYGPSPVSAVACVFSKNEAVFDKIMEIDDTEFPEIFDIAGMSLALENCNNNYWDDMAYVSKLRAYFEHQLLDIEGLRINGSIKHRMYNTSNITFPDPEKIIALQNKFEFSDNLKTSSHALAAMGLTPEEIKSTFSFSFGKNNTLDEVKLLVEEIMK